MRERTDDSLIKRIETPRMPPSQRRSFAVVGPLGAVEFWFHVDNMDCSGFEKHSRSGAGHWLSPDNPSHTDCSLLGGNCWHDGTSLWASEYWVPGFKAYGDEWVWRRLELAYAEQFENVTSKK